MDRCLFCNHIFNTWEQIQFTYISNVFDKRVYKCFKCHNYTQVFIKTVSDLEMLFPKPLEKRPYFETQHKMTGVDINVDNK